MTKLLRTFVLTLCLLAVATPTFAANDFSGSNVISLWRFENNANDSIGSNHLTEVNTPAYVTGGSQLEGTYSIDFDSGSNEYCTRSDADLSAGFPAKAGEPMTFSVCFLYKPETLPSYAMLVTKGPSNGQQGFFIFLNSTTGQVRFDIGHSGSSSLIFDTALSTGVKYHIACTYNIDNNAMKIRIWDYGANQLLDSNKTGTSGANMISTSTSLYINKRSDGYFGNGIMDELVIFAGEALSDADIDKIWAGTYGAAVGVLRPFWFFQ